MRATALPDALDALVALATAAVPAGCSVLDGKAANDDGYGVAEGTEFGDVVTVGDADEGYDGTLGQFASASQVVNEGLSAGRTETLTVAMRVESAPAEPDRAARRRRVAEILTALDQAIRDDPHLGGAVEHCWLGTEFQWFAGDTGVGDMVAVTFAVLARVPV